MTIRFKPLPPEQLGAVIPDVSVTTKHAVHGFKGVARVVVVGLVVWGGLVSWNALDESGYIYHDKITTVYGHDWTDGEYKECSNVNAKTDEPYLQCDDLNLIEKGKVFKVRFYGQTYAPEKPFETIHEWKCRKDGGDPSIACHMQDSEKSAR